MSWTTTTFRPPQAPSRPRAAQVAAATPLTRERYVDALRVASLAVVVVGHVLMADLGWEDGRLRAANALETMVSAQWLTWVFQVMPLFFLVGGYANAASWSTARRGAPARRAAYGTWLGGRVRRLVGPALAFAAVWTAAAAGLALAGVDLDALRAGSLAQPLWFLAVYAAVVALAPPLVAAQRRFGWAVPSALAAGVAAVDLARFGAGVPVVGWANLALVWLFAHQLGIAWRQGGVNRCRPPAAAVVAAGGLAGLVALTTVGGYPLSMVGVGGGRSNMLPPSLALVALAVWQFGLVLALRGPAERWLARPRVWTGVVAAGCSGMTVYLWHLTALALVALATVPTGLVPDAAPGAPGWWAWRPAWLAATALVVLPITAFFARFERSRPRPSPSPRTPVVAATTAVVALMAGFGLLAREGFAVPLTAATGVALLFGARMLVARDWFPRRAG